MPERDGRAAHSAFAGDGIEPCVGVISCTDLLKLATQWKDYGIEQLGQYVAPGPQALERPFTQWGRVQGEHAGVEGGF